MRDATRRPPVEVGPRTRQALTGLRQRRLGSVELHPARASALGVHEHVGDRTAVLAHQPLGRLKTLFDLLQCAVLAGESFAVLAQLTREILRLDHDRAQPLGEPVQVGIHARDRVQACDDRREQRYGAWILTRVRREPLCAVPGGGAQRVRAAQPLASSQQTPVLGFVRCRVLDLGKLVLEQIELAPPRIGELAQILKLGFQRGAQTVRLGARAQALGLLRTAAPVENLQLSAGDRQLAMLVLTVEGTSCAPTSRSSPTVA